MEMIQEPWLGGINDLPPGFAEITKGEFWTKLQSELHSSKWASKWLVNIPKDHPLYGAKLFMLVLEWNKTGFGYVSRIERAQFVEPEKFFSFAECQHEYKDSNVGHCLTNRVCTKCGHGYSVDSSG